MQLANDGQGMKALRWAAAFVIAVTISALYATGFFYTNFIAIVGGFALCLLSLFIPAFVVVPNRLSKALVGAALAVAFGLSAITIGVHLAISPPDDLEDLGNLLVGGLIYFASEVLMLFIGALAVAWLAPRGVLTKD